MAYLAKETKYTLIMKNPDNVIMRNTLFGLLIQAIKHNWSYKWKR